MLIDYNCIIKPDFTRPMNVLQTFWVYEQKHVICVKQLLDFLR